MIDKHATYSKENVPVQPSRWQNEEIIGRELEEDLLNNQGYAMAYLYARENNLHDSSVTWHIRREPSLAVKIKVGKIHYYLLPPETQEKFKEMRSLTNVTDYEKLRARLRSGYVYNVLQFADETGLGRDKRNIVIRLLDEGMPHIITGYRGTSQNKKREIEIDGDAAKTWLRWRPHVYSIPHLGRTLGYDASLIRDLVKEGFFEDIPDFAKRRYCQDYLYELISDGFFSSTPYLVRRLGKKKNQFIYARDLEKLKESIEEYVINHPNKSMRFKGERLFINIIRARQELSAREFTHDILNEKYNALGTAMYRRLGKLEESLDATAEYLRKQGKDDLAEKFSLKTLHTEKEAEQNEEDERIRQEAAITIKSMVRRKQKITWEIASQDHPDIAYALRRFRGFAGVLSDEKDYRLLKQLRSILSRDDVITALLDIYEKGVPMTAAGAKQYDSWIALSAQRHYNGWWGAIDAVREHLETHDDPRAEEFTRENLTAQAKEKMRARRGSIDDALVISKNRTYDLQEITSSIGINQELVAYDVENHLVETEDGKLMGRHLVAYLRNIRGWMAIYELCDVVGKYESSILKEVATNVDAVIKVENGKDSHLLFNPDAIYRFEKDSAVLALEDIVNLREMLPARQRFDRDDLLAMGVHKDVIRYYMPPKLKALLDDGYLTTGEVVKFLDAFIKARSGLNEFCVAEASEITGLPYITIYNHRKAGNVNPVEVYATRSVGIDRDGLIYFAILSSRQEKPTVAKTEIRKPKKSLAPDEIQEIIMLAPVVPHNIIMAEYETSSSKMNEVVSLRPSDLAFNIKGVYSNEKLKYSADLFRNTLSSRMQRILMENVFYPLATQIGEDTAKQYKKVIHPFFNFYVKAYGLRREAGNAIKDAVERLVTEHTYASLLDHVLSEPDELNMQLDSPTLITYWLYAQARSMLIDETKPFMEELFGVVAPHVIESERKILETRYMSGALLKHSEVASIYDTHTSTSIYREKRAAERAREINVHEFNPDNFIHRFVAHINGIDEQQRWAA